MSTHQSECTTNIGREDSGATVALEPFFSFLQTCDLQLTQTQSDKVVDTFIEMGAESVKDLHFIKEIDLAGILPLIKCRKLISCINNEKRQNNVIASADSIVDSSTSTASDDSNVHEESRIVYSIPWERFSKDVKLCLENKKRPTPKERREVVRVLCDEIHDKCASPQRRDIQKMAEMMVNRYPISFEDRSLGGRLIQDGSYTLFTQMENRIYNMKQGSDTSNSSENEGSSKKKKSLWNINPEYAQPWTSSSSELESLRSNLIRMYEDQEDDSEKINMTLIKCLAIVRESILTKPLKEVQRDWPILFTANGFKLHYQAVMKKSLDDVIKIVYKSRRNVLGYMQIIQHKVIKLQSVLKSIQSAEEEQRTQTEIMGIAALVCSYFSEDFSLIYVQVCKILQVMEWFFPF